jgi:hypothetical protein
MSHLDGKRRKPAAAAVLVLLLACIGLAACGSSSKSSSASTNASAATTTSATGTRGPGTGRFAAMRECLQKNGITLPKRTPGQRRPGGPGGAGGFLGGGAAGAGAPALPKGVTRAQYEAAIKKCGGGSFAGGGARFKSPAFKAALAKFATCLNQNGVKVPAPNTSGNGPVFDTKGINTSSAQFKTAESKCRSDLVGAFRRGPGAGGPRGSAGAPPSGGGAPPSGGAGGAPPAG